MKPVKPKGLQKKPPSKSYGVQDENLLSAKLKPPERKVSKKKPEEKRIKPIKKPERMPKPMVREKKNGFIGLVRKSLKVVNGLFFGIILLAGAHVFFTEPGKIYSLVIVAIFFGIAFGIHTLIDKIFG